MKWKIVIACLLLSLLIGGVIYYMSKPNYPTIVNLYKYRFKQMSELENKKFLITYTDSVMGDSVERLNYSELLEWQHKYMVYPASDSHKVMWQTKVELEGRPEEPTEILGSRFKVYDPSDRREKVMGKCGEFTLVYCGLLLVNNYQCRIIIDCSISSNKSRIAGDHCWIEILINSSWLHCDPTEGIFDEPYLYRDGWKKEINKIYAVNAEEILDVTSKYN